MVWIASGSTYPVRADPGGTEIFVVSGSIRCGDAQLPAESWLRFPAAQAAELRASVDTVLWMKRGHLPSDS